MFIEYAVQGRSTRDKELLDSKAKAHAARWAHQKLLQRRNIKGTRFSTRRAAANEDAPSGRNGRQHQTKSLVVNERSSHGERRADLPELSFSNYENWNSNTLLGRIVSPLPTTVLLDSTRLRSIEYFPELWSRWAADVIPNRADRQAATDVAVSSIVQRCLTDELHMTAFTSYVLQRAPAANVSAVFLLRTAGKAISELRSRIEAGNASLEEVVWPIIFLAHYELYGSKSVGAGRAHLKAVIELGGMEYLDEVTKVYIRRMDRGWWSDYPSIFPSSPSPKPQWERLVPEMADDDVAGSGFSFHADMLGPDLMNVLLFAVDCVRAGVFCKDMLLWRSEDEHLQNKVIRRCQDLMDALRERLPSTPEKMASIYPTMIWLQYTTWVMRDLATKASSSVDAYRNITSHAHPTLLRCVEGSQECELLLWAVAVGIATSSDEAVRMHYARCGLRLARGLRVVDLRNCWRGYIWFEGCAIIDYSLVRAAFDNAVKEDPLLATQY